MSPPDPTDRRLDGETSPRDSVVLIAGVARSGSTMLDLMLGNRPDAFSCGEIYARYRPFRPHHLAPVCACGANVDDCPVWRKVGEPRPRHLHAHVLDSLGVSTVIDSSKNLAWIHDVSRWAGTSDRDVLIVLAWRHPRQIACSYWKRGDDNWADHLRGYVERLDDFGLPFHVVQVDRLVAEPGPTLERLCADLGSNYRSGQERFWEHESHHLFGSATTGAQVGRAGATLAEPELPRAFVEYWDALPAALRSELQTLHERVVSGETRASAPRRWPPSWYLRDRLQSARATTALRRRTRTR